MPRHRAALLACALAIAGGAIAAASPASATGPDGAELMAVPPASRSAQAPQQERIATKVKIGGGLDCKTVRARLTEYAARGVKRAMCATYHEGAAAAATVSAASVPGLWCSSLAPGYWWITRTEGCVHGGRITAIAYDADTGEELGRAEFSVASLVELAAGPSTDVVETAEVQMTSGTGLLAAPVLTHSARCTAPCQTYDGVGFTSTMTTGEVEGSYFSYLDNPGADKHSFETEHKFSVGIPEVGSLPSVTVMGPSTIRCDGLVGNRSGCVFPAFTPELVLPVAVYRAAAVNIRFAQGYLPDQWGYAQPLTRQASTSQQEANRNAICRDGTFFPIAEVVDDSCDEFAFAASRQSGGELGLTGSACAEIVPVETEPGTWGIWAFRYTGAERCVRAHVPLAENSAVGTALSNFTQKERILDEDPYTVYAP